MPSDILKLKVLCSTSESGLEDKVNEFVSNINIQITGFTFNTVENPQTGTTKFVCYATYVTKEDAERVRMEQEQLRAVQQQGVEA